MSHHHDEMWKLRESANPTPEELKSVQTWAQDQSKTWANSGFLVWQDLPTMYEAGYWKGALSLQAKLDKAVKALESQMHCYCRAGTVGPSLKTHGFDCPYRISREALASIRGEKP